MSEEENEAVTATTLSAAERAMTKKEAQKKLSAEKLKQWKQAQKSMKKRQSNEDDDSL